MTQLLADLLRTCWKSYWLPRTMLVAQGSCHPPKAGQGNFREEAFSSGLVYHLLMHYFGHTHALLVMGKTQESSSHTYWQNFIGDFR